MTANNGYSDSGSDTATPPPPQPPQRDPTTAADDGGEWLFDSDVGGVGDDDMPDGLSFIPIIQDLPGGNGLDIFFLGPAGEHRRPPLADRRRRRRAETSPVADSDPDGSDDPDLVRILFEPWAIPETPRRPEARRRRWSDPGSDSADSADTDSDAALSYYMQMYYGAMAEMFAAEAAAVVDNDGTPPQPPQLWFGDCVLPPPPPPPPPVPRYYADREMPYWRSSQQPFSSR